MIGSHGYAAVFAALWTVEGEEKTNPYLAKFRKIRGESSSYSFLVDEQDALFVQKSMNISRVAVQLRRSSELSMTKPPSLAASQLAYHANSWRTATWGIR